MARARQVKSSRDYRVVATAGLEDASTCEPVSDGSWTALDERQLIRLLTDSAP